MFVFGWCFVLYVKRTGSVKRRGVPGEGVYILRVA